MQTSNLIRAQGPGGLSLEEMQQRLPAIFASQPHSSRSDRYIYIDTCEVIDALIEEDFQPVEARTSRSRDEGRRGFVKHMIRFRKINGDNVLRVGDAVFEIVLRNAHDGTASYELMAGLFRALCLNGLVASIGDLVKGRIRHTGKRERQLAEVVRAAHNVLEIAPRVLEAPLRWGQINLREDEQLALVRSAHRLRFANAEGISQLQSRPNSFCIRIVPAMAGQIFGAPLTWCKKTLSAAASRLGLAIIMAAGARARLVRFAALIRISNLIGRSSSWAIAWLRFTDRSA